MSILLNTLLCQTSRRRMRLLVSPKRRYCNNFTHRDTTRKLTEQYSDTCNNICMTLRVMLMVMMLMIIDILMMMVMMMTTTMMIMLCTSLKYVDLKKIMADYMERILEL